MQFIPREKPPKTRLKFDAGDTEIHTKVYTYMRHDVYCTYILGYVRAWFYKKIFTISYQDKRITFGVELRFLRAQGLDLSQIFCFFINTGMSQNPLRKI